MPDSVKPLVSVLTPVRNEEIHIDTMIESVLSQSYPHWELVIVDDDSADSTVARVEGYAASDRRVRLVHRGGRLGKVRAFNTAFEACRGDIVCHVGGDDVARPHALVSRVAALRDHLEIPAAAYFHLNMFSDDPDHGVVVPRGAKGSRSGPSTTLTRPLAEQIFPIPEHLPSEDLWVGEASHGLARQIVHSPEVVIDYRTHAGNSNPRYKPFEEMSESIHRRMAFAPALLEESRFELNAATRRDLERRWSVEQLRRTGRTLAILRSDLRLVDRLAIAAMSDRHLWELRKLMYRALSGWRGR